MGTKSIQKQIKSKHPEEYLTVNKGVRCHIERISYTGYYLILIILYILSIYLHLWYIYRLSSTRVYLHSTLLFPDCNDIGYYHDNVTLESTRDYFRSIVAPLPLSWLLWYCVVPQNIHTPPPPTEDHWKFQGGGGGFKGSYFWGVGGVHGKLLFQRVTNHEQNIESNVQSIVSTKAYVCCLETKIGTPGHWDEVNIISFNVSVFLCS